MGEEEKTRHGFRAQECKNLFNGLLSSYFECLVTICTLYVFWSGSSSESEFLSMGIDGITPIAVGTSNITDGAGKS